GRESAPQPERQAPAQIIGRASGLTPIAKARQGKPGRASKRRRMARRRKRRTLKPSVPKRVKQRKKRARKTRSHQHPELVGLGLVAVGLFLVAVLWAGWNGGYVGAWIGNGLDSVIGSAALGLPPTLAPVGSLM